MLTLYHLPISHYSEKARWALDYKGLPYRSKVLAAGFHRFTVYRVGRSTTVPLLVDSESGARITDSTDILQYLERLQPEPALFPDEPEGVERVRGMEEYFDERCARAAVRYIYSHLLDHPTVLARLFQQGLAGWQRGLLRVTIPILRWGMRREIDFSPEAVQGYRAAVFAACDRLESWLDQSGGEYLAGDSFSVADLTAACLLGPVVGPAGSPWHLPEPLEAPGRTGFPPPALVEFLRELEARPTAGWIRGIWERHRQRPSTTSSGSLLG